MENQTTEVWKAVSGYEGFYEVSDYGNVKSLNRVVNHAQRTKKIKERIFSYRLGGRGYPVVNLARGGHNKTFCTYKLVMLAFNGFPPNGTEIAHNNGNKLDSRLSNLRYDTPKGNNADKINHGTNNNGERNGISKLTEIEALEIYKLRGNVTQRVLALRYSISISTISMIQTGKRWQYATQ